MSDFKMTRIPELMSDTGIHRLTELEAPMSDEDKFEKLFGGDFKQAEAVQAAMNRLERLMQRDSQARTFDLRYDFASYRPKGQEWICVDLNTYDGSPDAEAPCTFCGRGGSEKEARMNLLGQFWDFDNPDKPIQRPGICVHSSPVEPPSYIDNPGFRDDDDDAFDGGLSDLDEPR